MNEVHPCRIFTQYARLCIEKKPIVKNLLLDQIHFENNNENKLIISIRIRSLGTEADVGRRRMRDGGFSLDTSASRTEADQGQINFERRTGKIS